MPSEEMDPPNRLADGYMSPTDLQNKYLQTLTPYNLGKVDWTYEHIRTLIYWMNIANINIFLLDGSIQYYKKIVMQVMAFTFLFSSLSTTISISQLGISATEYPNLSNGIQYTFVAASTISTILVGYIKLFKLQEMMDANIEMHKEWLEFATRISGELQMPPRLRKPALQLLQDMKASYIGLFCKRPFIPAYVKRYANRYFSKYTLVSNSDQSSKCLCCTRTNYIKRTNIFFVFQDIMKNEIKRLAAEIEIDNMFVVNPNESAYIDGPLAAGSTELGMPRLPLSSELRPNIRIRYTYEGPFINIEVVEKEKLVAESAEASYDMGINRRTPKAKENVGGGFLRNIRKGLGGDDNDEDSIASLPAVGRYRERAHSFQDPERSLYTQMQQNTTSPSRSSSAAAYVSAPTSSYASYSLVAAPAPTTVASPALPKTSSFTYGDNLELMKQAMITKFKERVSSPDDANKKNRDAVEFHTPPASYDSDNDSLTRQPQHPGPHSLDSPSTR
jgi:hypothetical protein